MMKSVLEALVAARGAKRKVVFTSLVETRGSTPQKAGAAMLVFEDGTQVGTLGGGCVEAEVKRKSLENLATGKTEIVQFRLNHDYGWDDGLICGGRMTMLISPVETEELTEYYERFLQLITSAKGCIEAVIVEEEVGDPGSRYLFSTGSEFISPAGTPAPPQVLIENLPVIEKRPRATLEGGISYLPCLPQASLLIIGAGHVGRALARYAADVDFAVTVVDDRENFCNRDNIPEATDWIVGDFDDVLPGLEIDQQTLCVIVTRGHNHDEEALFHLIQKQPRFLGMIGSKRKIRLIFDDLIRNGIDEALLKNVHAPIGLEIGSQTVPEIAISIVAQLIESRNR